MALDLNVGLLLLGAVLLLAALFAGVVMGSAARSGAAGAVRAVLGIAGAALLAWGALPYFRHPPVAVPPPPPLEAPAATTSLPGEPARAATAALEDCAVPNPPAVPDASTATKEQMMAARTAFKAFDTATNAYTACVDAAIDKVTKQFPDATPADQQTLRVLGTGAHNTAVDQEQAVADQFNVQVKAFNAKHPGH